MIGRRPSRRVLVVGVCLALGLSMTAAVDPAGASRGWSPGVDSWVTDLDTNQRLDEGPRTRWRRGPGAAGATIVVDPTRAYQTMAGFGASMTDSSAYVLSEQLSPRVRRQTMRELFSPGEGIGLSMLRQPMGASDFAVEKAYSYDDQPPGQSDPDLSDFSIRHDRAYILPRLREALALNPRLSFMASPWSAPGWMKSSGSMIKGWLRPDYHQAYADYFARFIKAYRRAGIPTHYVSMQNEPLHEPSDYPGMLVFPDQAVVFTAAHLAPTLEREGLGEVQILGYDHNWDITDYPEAMYADPRVATYVAGTAWHCYAGEVVAQSVSHNSYPHAQAFHTECSGGGWQGTQAEAFASTMASVIGVPRHWGQSVVLWNLALDERGGPRIGGCTSCRGVVTVNDDGTVTKELDYWALGHASRFVPPGAVRVGSSRHPSAEAGRGLSNVAFTTPDGSTVLVAHNATARPLSFDVQVGDRHFAAALAAGAAATYRWRAPAWLRPVAELGWVDLDFGPGPRGTPTGRLTASVGPEVLAALPQVRLRDGWLAYSLPYGAALRRSGETSTLDRSGWTLSSSVPESPQNQLAAIVDGNRATRWTSGAGQRPGMSVTIDLGEERRFSEIALDVGTSIGDYLRHYAVQVSDDARSWTDIAIGPGHPTLTGDTVIALPPTTTRHLRLLSATTSLSWWSIHELNLRSVAESDTTVLPGGRLRAAIGELPEGTTVIGYRNAGTNTVEVPWPMSGFGYSYWLPPTAAVTFGLLGNSPAALVQTPVNPAEQRLGPSPAPPR